MGTHEGQSGGQPDPNRADGGEALHRMCWIAWLVPVLCQASMHACSSLARARAHSLSLSLSRARARSLLFRRHLPRVPGAWWRRHLPGRREHRQVEHRQRARHHHCGHLPAWPRAAVHRRAAHGVQAAVRDDAAPAASGAVGWRLAVQQVHDDVQQAAAGRGEARHRDEASAEEAALVFRQQKVPEHEAGCAPNAAAPPLRCTAAPLHRRAAAPPARVRQPVADRAPCSC